MTLCRRVADYSRSPTSYWLATVRSYRLLRAVIHGVLRHHLCLARLWLLLNTIDIIIHRRVFLIGKHQASQFDTGVARSVVCTGVLHALTIR